MIHVAAVPCARKMYPSCGTVMFNAFLSEIWVMTPFCTRTSVGVVEGSFGRLVEVHAGV
ncbi:hypothetical protein D3C74_429080 [compost metagenome]